MHSGSKKEVREKYIKDKLLSDIFQCFLKTIHQTKLGLILMNTLIKWTKTQCIYFFNLQQTLFFKNPEFSNSLKVSKHLKNFILIQNTKK